MTENSDTITEEDKTFLLCKSVCWQMSLGINNMHYGEIYMSILEKGKTIKTKKKR